jgi:hypothetical protein
MRRSGLNGSDRFAAVIEYVAHSADLSADSTQLFFDVLVAAVHVVDAIKNGFAVGHKCSEDERGRGA